ncbi:Methyl-accepting chemotaxis protein McpB [Gallionellaceae bacterium]|nr:Methyl-accepting chemotaxis protein McpB [Gallionellaceae bacterium]
MKNISISKKLVFLLALPLLGLLAYSAISAQQNYQQWRNVAQTQSLMKLAVSLGNLAHYLQIERGATAGFVQSKGERFTQELPGYRAETDRNLALLKEIYGQVDMTGMPASFRTAVDAAISNLGGLKDNRDAASGFRISAPEAAGYYTRSIAGLLRVLPMISMQTDNAQINARMGVYKAFLGAKERAGQERALMVPIFVANKIEPAQYLTFLEHGSTQKVLLEHFAENALDKEIAFFKSKLTGPVVDDVETMRQTVISKVAEGNFNIEPTKWFAAATARINALKEVENVLTLHIDEIAAEQADQARSALALTVGFAMVNILVTIILGIWIIRSIITAIRKLHETIVLAQSNSDLTQRVEVFGKDEVGQAGEAFNLLMSSIQGIIRNVSESAEQVRHGAVQVSDATTRVTSGSQSQSEAASAMAAAMEQMTVSIDQVAEHASDAQKTTAQSGELSSRGGEVILHVVNDMRSIAETVNQSSTIIQDLGKQSDEIFSIVQVIKGVADQTNLLALNAAIEAARAGEQGRGFAVVADEVRKLAESTTHSTQVIAGMIDKIRAGTKDAVGSMEVCVNQVNKGVEMAGQAGEAITQISSGAQQVSHVVSDISSAIREQSIAISEVARNVERVAQMSDENYATAQNAASTVRNLEELAEVLENTVAKFKA